MNPLARQLKKLTAIKPDKDYARKSRLLLLSESSTSSPSLLSQFTTSLRFTLAISLTAFIIIITLGGVNYLARSPLPLTLAGLDLSTLKAEAENLQIDVSLAQIDHYQKSSKEVRKALNQTATNQPVYFESIILNKETSNLNLNDPVNRNVDQALKDLINS